MVNAALPMRRQKRGHIINVSSLPGLSSIPFLGIYSASKFALEGCTEALRHELKPFDIHVSLTEAGFLKTLVDFRRLRHVRVEPCVLSAMGGTGFALEPELLFGARGNLALQEEADVRVDGAREE